MRRPARALAVAALALLAGLLAAPAFAQCAMCKTALTASPEGRHMAGQLNLAILMLVFSPYVIAASVAGVLFRRQIGAWLLPWRARLLPGSRRGPLAP
jgi:hypothetical protein